ncbi:STAS domain-containing protein [Palleronia aestuarii]|uniref:STAS domain-containing protein n=1 Tax=Palleronia aestuarii TaxID=568105 RepID=A0A2W7MYY3_9RHOB|nr:STAS domain-containing protein [Palleronia aestuarii]PZX11357.1 STAS domain-containing protein [Palleronia aestuarii]
MSDPIVLPDKMPSSTVGDLSRLLTASASEAESGTEIRIDAGGVRSIGALAAEQLVRFVRTVEGGQGRVEITGSADFEDDLRILGLHDLLLRKGPST